MMVAPFSIIDIHTHILPGMDDGSPDTAVSLEMLSLEQKQNCTAVCLSPHYYKEETIDSFLSRRRKAYNELLAAAQKKNFEIPKLILAAEVAFFPGISRCENIKQLCIENTHTLLLEMPYSSWQDFEADEVISLVIDSGLQVVLVHPERFLGYRGNESKLERLLELPIGLQVNSGSLINIFTRKTALYLLTQTRFPLIGSDCHNLAGRSPNTEKGRIIIQKNLGSDFLKKTNLTGAQLCTPDKPQEKL